MMKTLDYSYISEKIAHKTNGDNFLILSGESGMSDDPTLTVLAVADGMTSCGDRGAPLASGLALQTIRSHLAPIFVDLPTLSRMTAEERQRYFFALAKKAILAADKVLWDHPETLGCTVSLAIVFDTMMYCINVGDSPIYTVDFRSRQLSACYEAQNQAGQMVRDGQLTEKEAQKSDRKYVLQCPVGGEKRLLEDSDIYTCAVRFHSDMMVLLGSDGALDVCPTAKLLRLTLSHRNTATLCAALRKTVRRYRGKDDFTVIAARRP